MEIRRAAAADADPISALVHDLSFHFLVAPPGSAAAITFFEDTSAERFRSWIAAANRLYLVAHDGDALAGFISIRDGRHVSQLFVAPRHQGRGLARRLWTAALDAVIGDVGASPPLITVDSSPNAVVVYERFGFAPTACRREHAGVVFVPMAFVRASQNTGPTS